MCFFVNSFESLVFKFFTTKDTKVFTKENQAKELKEMLEIRIKILDRK